MSGNERREGFWLGLTDAAMATRGVLSGSLVGYRGGDPGRTYFDFDQLVRDPGHMVKVAQWYVVVLQRVMKERVLDLLAFVKKNDMDDSNTLGVIPLVGLICTQPTLWLPHVVVRLDRALPHDRIKAATPGGQAKLLGGRTVAILTDHVSRGEELLQAISELASHGAQVTDAVAFAVWKKLLDDNYGPQIASLGVQFHYLNELRECEVDDGLVPELIPNWAEISEIDNSVLV